MLTINGRRKQQKLKELTRRESTMRQPPENAMREEPVHVGGGWYELSDGKRVRGKKEALKAMRGGR